MASRAGFTLVEALLSLVLSSFLVMLMSTVFVVQSDFYEGQLQRAMAQDNARSVTEVVASELRGAMGSAIQVATATQLVVRSPIRLAMVCAVQANHAHVHFEGGEAELDTLAVKGFGVFNDTTDTWSYYAANWQTIDESRTDSDDRCANNGTDTTGVADEFNRLENIKVLSGTIPPVGTVMMFYRETEFVLTTSALDATSIGLFKGEYGGSLVEFASGMDATAQFLYRTGGTTYATPITGSALANIDAVRLVASTRVRAVSGGQDDGVAGWAVNVPLRNSN